MITMADPPLENSKTLSGSRPGKLSKSADLSGDSVNLCAGGVGRGVGWGGITPCHASHLHSNTHLWPAPHQSASAPPPGPPRAPPDGQADTLTEVELTHMLAALIRGSCSLSVMPQAPLFGCWPQQSPPKGIPNHPFHLFLCVFCMTSLVILFCCISAFCFGARH